MRTRPRADRFVRSCRDALPSRDRSGPGNTGGLIQGLTGGAAGGAVSGTTLR